MAYFPLGNIHIYLWSHTLVRDLFCMILLYLFPFLFQKFIFINYFGRGVHAQHKRMGQKMTCRRQVSASTMWVPGIKFWLPGFMASPFTHRAVLTNVWPVFYF